MNTKVIEKLEKSLKYGDKELEICTVKTSDLKYLIQEYKEQDADLYEANNCISDLLDVAKERDRIIDLMLDTLIGLDSDVEIVRKMASINTKEKKEHLLGIYEERCK